MAVLTIHARGSASTMGLATTSVLSVNEVGKEKSTRKLKNAATAFLRHGLSNPNQHKHPNSHNPACNLPESVLRKLLHQCAQLDAMADWSWIMLTYVCRNWRRVALEYQDLWAFIDFSHAMRTSITLQRAKLVPLRVRAVVDTCNIADLRRAMQLAYRVEEIRLKSTVQHIQPLLECLTHPNAALRSLTVEVSIPTEAPQGTLYPPPSFPTDGPRLPYLTYLELKGCPFFLLTSRCTAITILHLSDLPPSERPSRRRLVGTLERLPNLQHLTLDRAFPVPDEQLPDSARRVLLPHLQTITLRGSIGEVADVLDNFILPSNAHLICTLCTLGDLKENVWKLSQAIGVHSWAAAEVVPLETLVITGKEEASRYISFQEINPDFRQSMRIRAYRADAESTEAAFDFTVGADPSHSSDEIMVILLGAIWRALALAHVHTLALQNLDIITQKSWTQLLRTLPSLRVLDITGHAPSGVVWALLLNARAHAQGDADGQRLLVPRLDDVYLHGVDCSRGSFMVSSSVPTYSHTNLDDSRFLDVFAAGLKERIKFGVRLRSLSLAGCNHVLQRVIDSTRTFVSHVVWDKRGVVKEINMDAFSPARYRFEWRGDRTESRHYFRLRTFLQP